MKFSIVILLFISQTLLFADSNARTVQKRWTRGERPSIRDRWKQIGEDIRRRVGSSREWLREGFGAGSFASPNSRPMLGQTQNSFGTPDLPSQNFDPSVVIVDKPGEEEDPNPFNLDLDFPLQMGFDSLFDRPKFWSFGSLFNSQRRWWNGPNVCVERRIIEGSEQVNKTKSETLEVEDESILGNINSHFSRGERAFSLQSTHCTETDNFLYMRFKVSVHYRMLRGRENKTTIVKHQCCHGFKRKNNNGCTQVDLKSLVQTMKDLKTDRMLQLAEKLGFYDKLIAENLTILSPTNEALIEYEDDLNKLENEVNLEGVPKIVRRRRETDNSMSETILMHMIPGFVKSDDFDDEQLLSSLSDSQRNIRINIYNNPKRVVTANCAPIISLDNYAKNGIVHILDRVMPMPSNTIGDIINEDKRFTILKNLIANTDLMAILKDNSKHFSFFAPTDDALSRLEKSYLNRLLDGQACVGTFIKNHITPNVLCSSAIQNYAQVKNLLDLLLPLKRDEDKVQVDGIRVIETDKLATNGVIHVIDGVLVTEKSQPISNFLERNQMKEYLDFIKESGLLEEWDSLENVSFFIPSINALRSLSPEKIEEIKSNSKELLKYHVVNPKTESCDWNNNEMLNSKSGNSIRMNVFGGIPGFNIRSVSTAQCVKIIQPNDNICSSNIHITDQFLMPPNGNITETLDSMQNFTVIRRILKNSGLEQELEKGIFTLLAPNDETFAQQLSKEQFNVLMNDPKESERFSRLHLLPEVVCCSGVNTSPLFISLQQIRTLDGSLISAHKTMNGRIRFGTARVTKCDVMATNAVIHVINKVLEFQPSIGTSLQFPLFEMIF